MRTCIEKIRQLLYARTECIWIKSYEEEVVINDIRDLLISDKKLDSIKLKIWSNTSGITEISFNNIISDTENRRLGEIPALFNSILEDHKNNLSCVYILRDLDKLIKESKTIRYIRDFKESKKWSNYSPFIVISPNCEIPNELQKLFKVIEYDLPEKKEISQLVIEANILLKGKELNCPENYKSVSDDEVNFIVQSCQGLTSKEIASSLRECMVKYRTLNLEFLSENKIQIVKKTGVLDYIVPKITLDDICGHNLLKKWLYEVKESFSPEAKEFGIEKIKGMAAIGVAGCGKTMSAEAFAGMMKIPLLSLSMSKIMN